MVLRIRGVNPRRRIIRQASACVTGWSERTVAVWPRAGAEQPALAVLGDAGRIDVSTQGFGKRMTARHVPKSEG